MNAQSEIRRFVVVGASVAGLRAVETARRRGYAGGITLIGDELHAPYERPVLSKGALTADIGSGPIEAREYRSLTSLAEELDINLLLGRSADRLDLDHRTVHVQDMAVTYDALVIASGARARVLPGIRQIQGVHTLRSIEDANRLRVGMKSARRAVIVGAGFIGAEVASSMRAHGIDVTIVESDTIPLRRALGDEMGAELLSLHVDSGVEVICGATVTDVVGVGSVRGVELSDGSEIAADLVLVGAGSVPNVEWLAGSGLALMDGVVCDAFLCADADSVYAAGDVARWPNPTMDSVMVRTENWTAASEQGAAAATNALFPDLRAEFGTVPYFWSDWYGQRIQMAGVFTPDSLIVRGSVHERDMVTLFARHGRLVGALTLNRPADIMKFRALIKDQVPLSQALEFVRSRRGMAAAGVLQASTA